MSLNHLDWVKALIDDLKENPSLVPDFLESGGTYFAGLDDDEKETVLIYLLGRVVKAEND